MRLRSYCFYIVLAGALIIWTIKLLIRPYLPLEGAVQFGMGIAPNALGSFLIPFAAYWLLTHPACFNGRLLRFSFFSDTRLVCLSGFVLLVINEYLQRIPIFGRTFDWYDILFSAVGLTLSGYSFSRLQRRAAMSYGLQQSPTGS